MSTFTLESYQNEYLPDGGVDVDAVVTVTASGSGDQEGTGGRRATEAVEIIMVDTSGSMDYPPDKIRAARDATRAAIDCISDGVWFGVISGTQVATQVFPTMGGLAQSTPETRAAAKRALAGLRSHGGTAIGSWLALADSLFQSRPNGIHHAILLTDGKDESERSTTLDSVLAACQGRFQCDCRGVGTDWIVSELRKVSSALLGTVDIIPDPAGLEADFRNMMENAMGKELADVALRVWTPQGATVRFVKQVAPTIEDLTAKGAPVNPLTSEYPTGAWGDESRDYHLGIRVRAGKVGDEMLAGRASLIVGGEVQGQALIKAIWTDDSALSTRINREVAHYTGQAELAQVIQEGLEARKAGDEDTATSKLGRAVQLAAAAGNESTTKLLAKVVDVEEAATGTVRLKPKVNDADEMALDTRSTKTIRVNRGSP